MSCARKLWALVQQRCPRCRTGPLYERCLTMHEHCPRCGLRYEREPGYFMGSLYLSYGIAVSVMVALFFALQAVLADWDSGTVALLAVALFAPLTPWVSRYARTLWMYFDHWAWPEEAM